MSAVVEALHSIRLLFTENLGLKAGAVGLAILMFSLVHGAEHMERSMYVGVVVQPPSDAQDMILVTEIPDRVRVRLKGSRARLNAIRQENLPPVDVRLKTKEEPQYYFEKEMFDLRCVGHSGRSAVLGVQVGAACHPRDPRRSRVGWQAPGRARMGR